MLWDVHMHSHFSGDSKAKQDEMTSAAIEKGLGGICFTDHMDMDYPDDEVFEVDLEKYFPETKKTAEEFEGRIEVLTGIELGLQPHLSERHHKLLKEWDFDFVIGSSHLSHGRDPYYPEYYDGRTVLEAYREYFESIYENIQAFDGFDVYGHIDYVVRYGPGKDENYSYEAFSDILDAILKLLVEKGKGIEVNTGGLRKGLKETNPCIGVIKRFKELGGEIITLGADAHRPSDVAYGFEMLPGLLKECGFAYFTVFEGRKPMFVKI